MVVVSTICTCADPGFAVLVITVLATGGPGSAARAAYQFLSSITLVTELSALLVPTASYNPAVPELTQKVVWELIGDPVKPQDEPVSCVPAGVKISFSAGVASRINCGYGFALGPKIKNAGAAFSGYATQLPGPGAAPRLQV